MSRSSFSSTLKSTSMSPILLDQPPLVPRGKNILPSSKGRSMVRSSPEKSALPNTASMSSRVGSLRLSFR